MGDCAEQVVPTLAPIPFTCILFEYVLPFIPANLRFPFLTPLINF
jgi:hypothetical protein